MIKLELVNESTFKKVVDMKLSPEQSKFVAPNVVSLAQAWLYRDEARPFAIMNYTTDDCSGEGEAVGFMMLDWDVQERSAGIWRFMIAPEHQGKRYGFAALEAAVQLAVECEDIDVMTLDYVKENTKARDLYKLFGFYETGKIENGEIVMVLPLTPDPKVGMLYADKSDEEELLALVADALDKKQSVPEAFSDSVALCRAICDDKLIRLTIYGETIGIATENDLLIVEDNMKYYDEAKEKLVSFLKENA